jgi:phenylacetate-CoA ligase
MLFKTIYLIGEKLRNPSLRRIYTFLKQSENWELDTLESYQLQKLKSLLIFANEYSPYYREAFKGIAINKIESLSDLKNIPILEKPELYKNIDRIQSKFTFKKLKKASTSGTSGASIQFYRDEYADSFNRASILRGYSWFDVSIWEKNGYFWGFNFSFLSKLKTAFFDFLQHRFRLFSFEEKTRKAFVKQLKNTKYLHGYSSMIYETAKYINKEKLPKPSQLRMIKGTSENILKIHQKEIKQAFGLKMISEYGATEAGIIAFECKKGSMHLNMESCIVEEIDHEIIVTNLQMKSFPIIRYKLGDYIQLSSETCTCGLKHKILEEVTGRVGSIVRGKQNSYPSLTFYYIFKNLESLGISLSYQIIQNKKGEIHVYIEQHLSDLENKMLQKEMTTYFDNDLDYKLIQDFKIKIKNKKQESFISNL